MNDCLCLCAMLVSMAPGYLCPHTSSCPLDAKKPKSVSLPFPIQACEVCGQRARMSLCQQRILRQLEVWRKLFGACNQVSAGTLSPPHWARHSAQELETGREFATSSQARSREVQRRSWAVMGHNASS